MISKLDLEFILKQNEYVVIDFFADWCPPCQSFLPIFEKVADDYTDKVFFVKINIDNSRDIAIHYRISSIPTVLFFKKEQIVNMKNGFLSEPEFIKLIESLISK